jgi:MFS family permease
MRRLLVLASVMVFFDVTFFSAISPLLPEYKSEFGLSKAGAGVLAGAYAVGTLIASLPAGWLATRLGSRRTVIGGLFLLGASSVVFGFGEQIVLLDVARFVQGVAGALIWAGALTWLIVQTPVERRGSVIGTALGAAVAGALVGPAFGALAAEIGTEIVFGGVLVAALILAYYASKLPETGEPERQSFGEVASMIISRPVLNSTAFVTAPSVMFGAVEVLVPLRIDDLGGGHALIATGFIAGAGFEAVLAPIAGRYSDRVGRRGPYVAGMAICAVAMGGLALAQTLGLELSMLIMTSLGAGICFTPALTSLSEAAEETGLHQGYAGGLSNMAWAMGQVVGALAGGAIAGALGNVPPSFAISALLIVTAAYAYRTLSALPAGEPSVA